MSQQSVRAPSEPPPVAPGTGIRMDPRTRRRRELMIGGSPLLFLRLSTRGAQLVARWSDGEPIGPQPGARQLASRLVDSGMAHPFPQLPGPPASDLDVVIPVRDQARGLAATVASLGPVGGIIVVDDGSADPAAITAAAGHAALVLRHPRSRGPAAARNLGWQRSRRGLVAFLDADCTVAPGGLEDLLPYFADPRVAAVAPRVAPVALPGTPRALASYEALHSPLDMGARPGPVRPRSWVPYVPTACLIVRRRALQQVGGFDERLRSGEDVDMVWRLGDAGWTLRYQPAVVIRHPVRGTRAGWARQRYSYGRSAAELAARHGDAVAPLEMSPWSAAAWALGAGVHPLVGLGVAAASATVLARRARTLPPWELARAVVIGHARSGAALSRALRREWWPLALAAGATSRRGRRVVAGAVLGPPLAEWLQRRPPLDPLRWCLLSTADGLAYGAGVWAGCLRARSPAALLPRRSAVARPPAAGQNPGPT